MKAVTVWPAIAFVSLCIASRAAAQIGDGFDAAYWKQREERIASHLKVQVDNLSKKLPEHVRRAVINLANVQRKPDEIREDIDTVIEARTKAGIPAILRHVLMAPDAESDIFDECIDALCILTGDDVRAVVESKIGVRIDASVADWINQKWWEKKPKEFSVEIERFSAEQLDIVRDAVARRLQRQAILLEKKYAESRRLEYMTLLSSDIDSAIGKSKPRLRRSTLEQAVAKLSAAEDKNETAEIRRAIDEIVEIRSIAGIPVLVRCLLQHSDDKNVATECIDAITVLTGIHEIEKLKMPGPVHEGKYESFARWWSHNKSDLDCDVSRFSEEQRRNASAAQSRIDLRRKQAAIRE